MKVSTALFALVVAICCLSCSVDADYILEDIKKAAKQGHAKAQFALGYIYDQGDGVPQDDTEAVKWYRKAAEQGHAKAQFVLGNMYAEGRGVPQDDVEAINWYRKAAEQGNAPAQLNLGYMYANGDGVPEDYALAYMWFNLAAAKGVEGAKEYKSELSQEMSREQIAEAQAMSRKWLEDFEKKNKE